VEFHEGFRNIKFMKGFVTLNLLMRRRGREREFLGTDEIPLLQLPSVEP
jgi:hypothetical protein